MRFNAGDIAIFAVARNLKHQPLVGENIEVIAVGPFKAGQLHWFNPMVVADIKADCDYLCIHGPTNRHIAAMDWQLRKPEDPADPEALKRPVDEEQQA